MRPIGDSSARMGWQPRCGVGVGAVPKPKALPRYYHPCGLPDEQLSVEASKLLIYAASQCERQKRVLDFVTLERLLREAAIHFQSRNTCFVPREDLHSRMKMNKCPLLDLK